jgi:hypothetical protein
VRRQGAALLALAFLLGGCVGGGTPAPDTRSGSRSESPVAEPSVSESASPPGRTVVRLPAITLLADLSEPPMHWIPVMFVPFGDGPAEAGAILKKRYASRPVVPPSFAIDRDGSLWLLDLVKARIEHYSPTGVFLGAVRGLQFNRFRPYAQDLGFMGNGLFVAEFTHNTLQTYVREVSSSGIGPRVRVEAGGQPVLISHLVSPERELTGFSTGSSGDHGQPPGGGGIIGFQEIDPSAGTSRSVPGMEMADGSRLGPQARLIDDGDAIVVTHTTGSHVIRRRFHLEARPTATSPVRIKVVAGWETYVALPHGFATYMGFSPSRTVDLDRYQGSERWLFEYFDDGRPLVWEPLPESPLEGAYVWRYLAEGLDGHLYLMLAERGGMRIYRRPGPADT